jgi:hypothetical protein
VTVAKVAIALIAGIVVLVALLPASGAEAWCYSLIGYEVPCRDGLNVAAGAATAAVTGLALRLSDRVRQRRNRSARLGP